MNDDYSSLCTARWQHGDQHVEDAEAEIDGALDFVLVGAAIVLESGRNLCVAEGEGGEGEGEGKAEGEGEETQQLKRTKKGDRPHLRVAERGEGKETLKS